MYIKLKLNASALTAVSYLNTTEFFITLLSFIVEILLIQMVMALLKDE